MRGSRMAPGILNEVDPIDTASLRQFLRLSRVLFVFMIRYRHEF